MRKPLMCDICGGTADPKLTVKVGPKKHLWHFCKPCRAEFEGNDRDPDDDDTQERWRLDQG